MYSLCTKLIWGRSNTDEIRAFSRKGGSLNGQGVGAGARHASVMVNQTRKEICLEKRGIPIKSKKRSNEKPTEEQGKEAFRKKATNIGRAQNFLPNRGVKVPPSIKRVGSLHSEPKGIED